MSRYRKKPVEVDARRLTRGNVDDIAVWCGGVADAHGVVISTLEGNMLARWDEWVIRGVKGEFYPCKPDIFAATYEPA